MATQGSRAINVRTAPSLKAKRPKPKRTLGDASDRADRDPTGKKRPRAPSWERDYQQIWKAVTDLGAEQFTGKEKKAYEARKIVERGGRVSSLMDGFFFLSVDLAGDGCTSVV